MATTTSKSPEAMLTRYFRGYVENVFMAELGFCHSELTDYIAELLSDFTHMDRANQLREGLGTSIDQVVSVMNQVVIDGEDVLDDAQKYAIYRHIGDFCLFWVGLFPEQVIKECGPESIVYYCDQGARAYQLAFEHSSDDSPYSDVLLFLATEFQPCVYGLQEVCKDWRRDSGQAGAGMIITG